MITNKKLYEYSNIRLSQLDKKYQHLNLNYHDWQDIKQEIMIRIFSKKNKLKDGLGFKAYISTVIRNSLKNQFRDRFCFESGDSRIAKLSVRYPNRLLTKTKEIDSFGNIETVYEPDMAKQEDNISEQMINEANEIINSLPEEEKNILRLYEEKSSWRKVTDKKNYQKYNKIGNRAIDKVKFQLSNPK